MSNQDLAIKAESITKIYRIGSKDDISDNLGSAVFNFLKSPVKNFQKYRSLYNFDDVISSHTSNPDKTPSDVLWALKDVSFEVKQGEVLGIIGRNGAGKSTLLKILCKITDPTYGVAEIRGKVSSLLEVGTGFHPELTGRENIYLNGIILGMRKNEVDRKLDEIIAFSGIEKFINTPVKRYSSGMRVRLAFSVAAHLEPEVLIIDEVLAVGDASFQKKCINKMEHIGQEGRTVLFVSHNMSAMTRLCSRAILIKNGKIVQDGLSSDVVGSYLSANTGTSAVHEWKDIENAPGGSIARLRAVRAKKEDGEVSDYFDIRYPIGLEMEFDVLEEGHVILPHFSVLNSRGECAFITIDQDKNWVLRPRQKGRYISTAWIYGNLLSEGMTYVSCYCMTLNPDVVLFAERSIFAFNVIDTQQGDSARGVYAKNIKGVVRPLLQWTTEFCSNEKTAVF